MLANFDRKEHLQHRAVSLRQHGFLVFWYQLFWQGINTTVGNTAIPSQKLCGTWHEPCNVIGRIVALVQETVMNFRLFCASSGNSICYEIQLGAMGNTIRYDTIRYGRYIIVQRKLKRWQCGVISLVKQLAYVNKINRHKKENKISKFKCQVSPVNIRCLFTIVGFGGLQQWRFYMGQGAQAPQILPRPPNFCQGIG